MIKRFDFSCCSSLRHASRRLRSRARAPPPVLEPRSRSTTSPAHRSRGARDGQRGRRTHLPRAVSCRTRRDLRASGARASATGGSTETHSIFVRRERSGPCDGRAPSAPRARRIDPLLDAAVTADPTAASTSSPQPFRMIDKILSGVVDDAADKAVARERRRARSARHSRGDEGARPAAADRRARARRDVRASRASKTTTRKAPTGRRSATRATRGERRRRPRTRSASSGDADRERVFGTSGLAPRRERSATRRRRRDPSPPSSSPATRTRVRPRGRRRAGRSARPRRGLPGGPSGRQPPRSVANRENPRTKPSGAPGRRRRETTTTTRARSRRRRRPTPRTRETADANDEHEGTPKEEGAGSLRTRRG